MDSEIRKFETFEELQKFRQEGARELGEDNPTVWLLDALLKRCQKWTENAATLRQARDEQRVVVGTLTRSEQVEAHPGDGRVAR